MKLFYGRNFVSDFVFQPSRIFKIRRTMWNNTKSAGRSCNVQRNPHCTVYCKRELRTTHDPSAAQQRDYTQPEPDENSGCVYTTTTHTHTLKTLVFSSILGSNLNGRGEHQNFRPQHSTREEKRHQRDFLSHYHAIRMHVFPTQLERVEHHTPIIKLWVLMVCEISTFISALILTPSVHSMSTQLL